VAFEEGHYDFKGVLGTINYEETEGSLTKKKQSAPCSSFSFFMACRLTS
jgi:hypothetical protein